jgi:hypothetical protein
MRHWDGIFKADVDWLDADTRAALNRSPWTAAEYSAEVQLAMAGEDVDEVQNVMLRRDWYFRAGLADALEIKRPDSPEQDTMDDSAHGWASDTANAFVALPKKSAERP